jgi:uroporphyrin-III C-methyltransferase/precorrin-2 dehydrogenase/sirohydrochlorin ferrochelatase
LRKVEKLLPFGAAVRVVAPDVLCAFDTLSGVQVQRRCFVPQDIDGCALVVAATNDEALNAHIAALCRTAHIPVNTVDDPQNCTFFFPALVQRGTMTVGITSGGASPSASVWAKEQIDALLPTQMGDILQYLADTRYNSSANASQSAALRKACFRHCMELGRPLTSDEEEALSRQEHSGTVALVGAGCGAADLITVRGRDLLSHCDAVVYDDLIDTALLRFAPSGAQRFSVGKRAGQPSARQEDICALLVRLAQEGKNVVRLKGGDAFVFGRGGEEAGALQAAGIPYRLVPGVTSAVAIPELAGIPVTHRSVSRSFHVITAQCADGQLSPDLLQCANMPGTLVILMGLNRLEEIAQTLLSAGRSPQTPAAVIHGDNTDAAPMAVRGTLGTIAAQARAAALPPPAVIVVGDAASLDFSPTAPSPFSI